MSEKVYPNELLVGAGMPDSDQVFVEGAIDNQLSVGDPGIDEGVVNTGAQSEQKTVYRWDNGSWG